MQRGKQYSEGVLLAVFSVLLRGVGRDGRCLAVEVKTCLRGLQRGQGQQQGLGGGLRGSQRLACLTRFANLVRVCSSMTLLDQ